MQPIPIDERIQKELVGSKTTGIFVIIFIDIPDWIEFALKLFEVFFFQMLS